MPLSEPFITKNNHFYSFKMVNIFILYTIQYCFKRICRWLHSGFLGGGFHFFSASQFFGIRVVNTKCSLGSWNCCSFVVLLHESEYWTNFKFELMRRNEKLGDHQHYYDSSWGNINVKKKKKCNDHFSNWGFYSKNDFNLMVASEEESGDHRSLKDSSCGVLNVCMTFNLNPHNRCWDISVLHGCIPQMSMNMLNVFGFLNFIDL